MTKTCQHDNIIELTAKRITASKDSKKKIKKLLTKTSQHDIIFKLTRETEMFLKGQQKNNLKKLLTKRYASGKI